jgi:hypothetical protein
MAVVNGAKTTDEIIKTVKAGFMKVIRVRYLTCDLPFCQSDSPPQIQWITSPLAMVVAQKFISPEVSLENTII